MSNSGTQLGLKHRILVSTNRCDTLETMHEWTLIYMARVMAREVFWAVKFHSKQWFHPSETEKLVWCHMCNMFHTGPGGNSTLIRWVSATDVLNWSPCSRVGKPKKDTLLWSYHFLLIYCIVLCCIVLYCIVFYCIVLETKKMYMFTLYIFNQMSLPFLFSSIMFVQRV